jgi:hypothetical protein
MEITSPTLGLLTTKVISKAGWASSKPHCPSTQRFADEFERVFIYADRTGQFAKYFKKLTSMRYNQFDSALAELRVAYYMDSSGFPATKWEPIKKDQNEGEYIVVCPSGQEVFVEVKGIGWESQLTDSEKRAGRARQDKHEDLEARFVSTQKAIQFAIQKAYKKFDPSLPNLLVIADDLFVPLEYSPEMFAQMALYEPGGYFTGNAFENLGGIGIFWIDQGSEELGYGMKLFTNGYARPSVVIPEAMVKRFQ